MTDERIVLIDTDAGIDDALAILMAIKAHQNPSILFRIVGITCVNGNTSVDNVTINVTNILETINATDIPIYRGASQAMVIPHSSAHRHHGQNGFGDLDETLFLKPKQEDETAIAAIIRFANENAGKLSIIALGPLTNLGLAVRVDNRIGNKIKDIFIMGGSSEGLGNITPFAEFNFHADPESVYVTLTSYHCPITIAPVELGRTVLVQSLDWRMNVLGGQQTPESHLMDSIEKKNLEGYYKELGAWRPYDSTIMAAFIEPSIVTETINRKCLMELYGQHTRGQLLIDFKSDESSHVKVITNMDRTLFQKMLMWALNSNKFYKD